MEEIITVNDLMVPLEEYAVVNENATLFDAVLELEAAQERIDRLKRPYLHRAILVQDDNGKIVGKISQLDILRALEPNYKKIGDTRAISKAGLSQEFLKEMMDQLAFCETSLIDMCGKAARIKVKDFMYTPYAREYVEADAPLCDAIHSLVIGQHQSLLVVEGEDIIGILRLTDVFMQVFEMMRTCQL